MKGQEISYIYIYIYMKKALKLFYQGTTVPQDLMAYGISIWNVNLHAVL